ncbi:ACP S-malonyltransferase [Candidatus Woesearchaeota archaeon]|nr:ACP S-malonyltransferase [Candidatus Woesearchaeota archaeon]
MNHGLFPGQGNQYVGMGLDLCSNFPIARDMYQKAIDVSGVDVPKLSFEGPSDEQKKTQNTQLITFVHSSIIHTLLSNLLTRNPFSDFAGHSIGEYAALYAANVFSFEDGVSIVKKRGELMSRKSFDEPSLVAVINADLGELSDFCQNAAGGELEISLYNAPDMFVVGGHPDMVKKHLDSLPGKKKIPLKISGPFHTHHYKDISEEFEDYLNSFTFRHPEIPVYSNVTGEHHTADGIRKKLAEQLYNPVLWGSIMRRLSGRFIELGPGKSLARFKPSSGNDHSFYSVSDAESLKSIAEILKES